VKAELEVKANKINYMRVMRKVCNHRQVLNIDGQVFEEVRMFKYLGVLTRGNKLNIEEIKKRITAGNECCYGLLHIFKFGTTSRISKNQTIESNVKPGCDVLRRNMVHNSKEYNFIEYMQEEIF
jgi:hypothetical protein